MLTVVGFTRLPSDPSDTADEIAAEAARLLSFIAPDAAGRDVRFVAGP